MVIADMVGSGISLSDNLGGGYIDSKLLAFSNALTAVAGVAQFGKWGNNPITSSTNVKDIYNVTKNVAEELPYVSNAKELCRLVNDFDDFELNSLKTDNPLDLAVAKKSIERIKIEAEAAGNAELTASASKALEKLGDVKFLSLNETVIENARAFIRNAIESPTTQFANDFETVRVVAHFLDPANSNALQALGGTEELRSIIKANGDMPCITCRHTDGSFQGVSVFGARRMDLMLADLMDFCKRFSSKPDFITKIKASLNHPLFTVREGTQHMLSTIRQSPETFNVQSIKSIDAVFEKNASEILTCATCKFDLEMNDNIIPKFYEFKSYEYESIIGLSSQLNQFKNYLSQVTDWSQFRYIFNRLKTHDLDLVKKEFQKIFINNATEIFNSKPSLFAQFSYKGAPINVTNVKIFLVRLT